MGWKDLFKKKDGADAAVTARVTELVQQLESEDWQTRLAACEALATLGPKAADAVPALQDRIVDENNDVCTAAAAALSAIERDI